MSKQRSIDVSVEKTVRSVKSGYRIVPSMEIKAWKAYLAVMFAAGFCAALIWSAYVSIYPVLKADEIAQVTLSTSATEATHKMGDEFPIQIFLNTAGRNIVAVQVFFSYDKNALQVISSDISGSDFNHEIKNTIDMNQGQGFLALARPTPGVSGAAIKVATVNLKALADVREPVLRLKLDTFDAVSDSAAILDDGQGMNVLQKLAYIFPAETPPSNPPSQQPVQQGEFGIISQISLTDTIVRLDWSSGPSESGNYIIERKTGKDDFSKIAETEENEKKFIDRSAKPSKLYAYRICQLNGVGDKICTLGKQVKTLGKKKILKPRFTAQVENGKIRLDWNPSYPADFKIVLQKRHDKQKKFTSFATASPETSTYQDEKATSGMKYTYRLVISVRGKMTQYSNNIKIKAP